MAPRKRQKVMRIDAALDAMRPMGFSDALVRKTVRDLLKVYGGNEYWPFIEEFSYKVLTDALLEKQKEEETDDDDEREEEERSREKQVVVHCQEDEVDTENHLSLKDQNLPTGFGGHDHLATSCAPPLLDGAPAIQRSQPSNGWISDDD